MVGPVSKALYLLDCVADVGAPARFSDLLDRVPFPRATLHRTLRSLVTERMLDYDQVHQTYTLGPRLMRLAHDTWRQSGLVEAARQPLDDLAKELGQTLHLARLDAGQVLYLDKRQPGPTAVMFSAIGKVGPAYCTGVGKAMLAFLPPAALAVAVERQAFYRFTETTLADPAALRSELERIRAEGYALDREEHETGIICCARADPDQ